MPTPRLGMIQMNVPDRKLAFAFYSEKLALPCREPHGSEGPFEVDLGNATLLVYGVDRITGSDHETQPVTVILYTDDLEKTVADWKTRGIEFVPISWSEDPTGFAGCPYGRFIALKDPFGNVLELLEPK